MARVERWSVRTLRQKMQGMLYERTAISRKPEELARQELEALQEEDLMTPDLVFRDPYLLDFLGLEDTYSERDLEAAILRELERFLLELGTDFSFIARQKRMTIGDRDFYLDLLFYHRSLRRLVAIELKLGSFDAAYKGQMELYLRWLDRYERRPGEEPPIGLILCGEKNREQIELLQLDRGEIRVAEYLVELPPKGLLEAKLHEAIRLARGQVEKAHSPEGESLRPCGILRLLALRPLRITGGIDLPPPDDVSCGTTAPCFGAVQLKNEASEIRRCPKDSLSVNSLP